MADEAVLGIAEIARAAGVTPGTILGWRRRHADFPAPVSASGRRLAFDRAETEAWLAASGLLELDPGPRLWRAVTHSARDTSLGEAVSGVAVAVGQLADRQVSQRDEPVGLAREIEQAVNEVGVAAVVNDLIDRYAAVSGISVTPARIADLMVTLAGIGEGATVLDPASGTGELLAAARARGAGRVLAQDASAEAVAFARVRLAIGPGRSAEVTAGDSLRGDAWARVEADAVICDPPFSDPELAWAQHALAHLKPGGRAVLLMPPSAAASPTGRQIRAELLRQGVLRAVIALPLAVAEPHAPLHLWTLQRPDGVAPPDLRTLFAHVIPDVRTGEDDDAADAGTMPAARWRNFTRTVGHGWDFLNDPARQTVASGGGANVSWCVARVEELLDEGDLVDASERLDQTVDLTPARVRAYFSALYRVKDERSAQSRQDVEPRRPADSLRRSRLDKTMIQMNLDGLAKTLRQFDWLGEVPYRRRSDPAEFAKLDWPEPGQPADPWQTATVAELARLGMLRFRQARSGPAEPVRVGDVIIPATVTDSVTATIVDPDHDGDAADTAAHVIRPNVAHLDSRFLAMFLVAPTSLRRAADERHGSRIDVRQLEVPVLPLADQERYGLAFRRLRYLASVSASLASHAGLLADHLTTGLTNGEISLEDESAPVR
jgi:predicted DNA-binding transcriptional regulator AlpA/protein-L-isoaspartate O-methyltransferase